MNNNSQQQSWNAVALTAGAIVIVSILLLSGLTIAFQGSVHF